LIRVNKQIYQESVGVLYSKNIFYFKAPPDLFNFKDQIGGPNRDLVRRIQIYIYFPPACYFPPVYAVTTPPKPLDLSGYTVTLHWAKALRESRLTKIVEMIVEGDTLDTGTFSMLPMPALLQQSIEDMLFRNQEGPFTPQLTLKGFGWNEYKKFPANWKLKTEQWFEEEWREVQE
jgi:hypothetical protein